MAPAPSYKMPTMVGCRCCLGGEGTFLSHYRAVASSVQAIYEPFREKHAMVRMVCGKVERAHIEGMRWRKASVSIYAYRD